MTFAVKRAPDPPKFVYYYRTAVDHAHRAASWADQHVTVLAAAFLAVAVIYAAAAHRRGTTRRGKLRATAASRNMADKIGTKLGWQDGERFIDWPRDPHADGAPVVVRYNPRKFIPQAAPVTLIGQVIADLAGGQWDHATTPTDHLHNRLRYIRRAPAPVLPARVRYTDDRREQVDLIPFAKDGADKWIRADLTGLTPHVLISATTGWGKSSLLSLLVAHVAGRGGLVDICDPKQIGFTHFDGLPMIRIATDITDMIDTVERFRTDMEHRYRAIKTRTAPTDAPLRVLVLDELGSFADMCVDHHQAAGGKGTPPVFRSMKRILWQGRAAGFHVISATQQANVKALFGVSDARDQYGLRVAAGPQSAEAWSMLFGKEPRPTLEQAVKGRAVVGIGAEFTIAQLAHLDPAEARRIASRGTGRHPVPVVHVVKSDPPETLAPVALATDYNPPVTARAGLTLVPRGRPPGEAREPLAIGCGGCGTMWSTRAAEGSSVKCPKCGKARRVPVGARATG